MDNQPRIWAEKVNNMLANNLHSPYGPFWGPHFVQIYSPDFNFDKAGFKTYRLVEQRLPGLKSIFQLGGVGSVGMQSLYGISKLAQLIRFCRHHEIPLHCWPFNGWEIPKNKHLLVEIYPALYNKRPKSDVSDAMASTAWFLEKVSTNSLIDILSPDLTYQERSVASIEGWVAGVC